ncbi:MAG TPA: head-tail connector protein, partial [Mycobacterium sp.]
TYRDMAGHAQTVAFGSVSNSIQRSTDGTLVADLSSAPARIVPAFGSVWPIALPEIGAIAVNYTAGYGDAAADVPQGLRNWILLRVATMYANREESVPGAVTQLPHVDGLLDPFNILMA